MPDMQFYMKPAAYVRCSKGVALTVASIAGKQSFSSPSFAPAYFLNTTARGPGRVVPFLFFAVLLKATA